MSIFTRYRSEIIVFLLAVSVRLIFFVFFVAYIPDFPFIGSDSYNYLDDARELLMTHRFIQPATGEPNSYEVPGYPLFLAGVIKIFSSPLAIPIIQNIFIGLCAVLLWHIGLVLSRRTAWIATSLFAFEPAGIFYSNYIVTEPLFIFLAVVTLFFLVKRKDVVLAGAFVPGVLLGVATLIRPVGELFLPAVLVFYFVAKNFSLKRTIIFFCAFLVGWLIVVAPWMVRNKVLFGSAELSAVASWQMYHSHAPHFYAYKNGIAERDAERLFQARLEVIDPYKEEVRIGMVGSLRHAPYMWQVGLDYIRQYPLQFGFFHIIKTIPFFVSDGLRQIARDIQILHGSEPNLGSLALRGDAKGLYAALTKSSATLVLFSVGFIFWVVVNALMVMGVVVAMRLKDRRLVALATFLILGILLTAFVAGGAVSHPRYRYSVSPFMFLLAAYGLSRIIGLLTFLSAKRLY